MAISAESKDGGAAIAARPSGRPRSARADEAIIDAALDLLAEGVGVDALSIESVASRAGVGKATIYRRWPGKYELLMDCVRSMKMAQPEPRGENVRDDLISLLGVIGLNDDSRSEKVFPCLIPEVMKNPDLRVLYQQLIEPRRARIRTVLQRGVATGELRADLDIELTTLMLSGPVVMQRMLDWNPAIQRDGLAERVVDALLAGAAPR
ncbi:AcrR family transcriptional regulator [Allocatelliglobosispora scoriae]|uniref:AcrR family transcriptional regulator n=1 Tax=Allocatelliglobosispora scoriae TaxID=643052 RepID=A0A841BZD4_9ACTN|nr:TetR/AcrR family transcriptional regulator [Allocatelliglobosispora scoriae]MBB5873045.1 AcrR family transcriptional regulator [Allocatelliglobosispora scoriae]